MASMSLVRKARNRNLLVAKVGCFLGVKGILIQLVRRRCMTKRIGILTSGGDCGGLNAAIRAVALRAHHGYGWTTVGLRNGTLGLLERPVDAVELDPDRLDAAVARQGGTFLGSTNRGDPFAFPMPEGGKKDRSGEMISGLKGLALDGLIGIGGDGSLDILRR